jgi:NitT/TauT family transport system ATP-binding protein
LSLALPSSAGPGGPATQPSADVRPLRRPRGGAADAHIRIANASKVYQTADGPVESLKPITLDIARGEFVVVVGPSGCGKSTLLKMAAGLLSITAGSISIDDRPVIEPADDVGIVFQSPVLLPWRNIFRNIMLPVEMRGLETARYRSEERRVGKECRRLCRSRWSPYH